MMKLIESVLKCSNVDEVKKVIDAHPKSIFVKVFNYYLLVLVAHLENEHYVTFKSVYFDMKAKTYVIEHHSGKYIENFDEDYLYCENVEGEYRFIFKSGMQVLRPHVSPKGAQYKISVKNGESGGGGNWSKLALGLEQSTNKKE